MHLLTDSRWIQMVQIIHERLRILKKLVHRQQMPIPCVEEGQGSKNRTWNHPMLQPHMLLSNRRPFLCLFCTSILTHTHTCDFVMIYSIPGKYFGRDNCCKIWLNFVFCPHLSIGINIFKYRQRYYFLLNYIKNSWNIWCWEECSIYIHILLQIIATWYPWITWILCSLNNSLKGQTCQIFKTVATFRLAFCNFLIIVNGKYLSRKWHLLYKKSGCL